MINSELNQFSYFVGCQDLKNSPKPRLTPPWGYLQPPQETRLDCRSAPLQRRARFAVHSHTRLPPPTLTTEGGKENKTQQLTGCWQSSLRAAGEVENPQSDRQKQRRSRRRTVHLRGWCGRGATRWETLWERRNMMVTPVRQLRFAV